MRNGNGQGSIIKLSGNRRKKFQVRVTMGFTDDGKQKYVSLGFFKTRAEAEECLVEYRRNPYDISTSKYTFAEVYENWSKQKFNKVSESSVVRYNNVYNRYCKELHSMRFRDIKQRHLQEVIDKCGKAYPTRASIKTLFSTLYNYAIENDISEKNYAKSVDIGSRERKSQRYPFSHEEIETLFKYVNEIDYTDTVLIMIYTGLRIGELLNIKIKDVHLDERYMVGGSKTEAGINRIIPINKKIEPFIRKYYEKNKDNTYLITNAFGRQMKYSNYRREKWDNIMEKMEFKNKHRPHDARHTFACLMDEVNANRLCFKRIIGHASQDITDEVYIHKTISQLVDTIDLI